ncbi:hypothetical protein BDV12DRAFT_159139 [Aspergillus spectabilis]
MTSESSIIYQNSAATVFLIDIPTSIALAQELSPQLYPCPTQPRHPNSTQQNKTRHLRSSSPLEQPYLPSTEPKTETARARVLARIPRTERLVHEAIEPVVLDALNLLRDQYGRGSNWCLPRYSLRNEADIEHHSNERRHSTEVAGGRAGKRRRWEKYSDSHGHEYCFQPSSEAAVETSSGAIRQPPLILSPDSNRFESGTDLCGVVVRNTSLETAMVTARCSCSTVDFITDTENGQSTLQRQDHTFIIPPLSNFVLCNIPISPPTIQQNRIHPIPRLPQDQKFNLILLDPPWSNRSVRRSRYYTTQSYSDNQLLEKKIQHILQVHSCPVTNQNSISIAAIWITNSAKARGTAYNSLTRAGFSVIEEWIWIKTTVDGQPISPVGGLWRKPYEVLVIGRKQHASTLREAADTGGLRRVIAAVPDVHSRKPNLREMFEKVLFQKEQGSGGVQYSALEVFARNLTAGWWACGNEVLKFNSEDWWVDGKLLYFGSSDLSL